MNSRISQSLEDTAAIAHDIAARLKEGGRLGLDGPLGAGKTTFVRALAKSLGVSNLDDVVSPTYTLVNEHQLPNAMTLVHIDFYRLEGGAKAFALGIEEEIWRPNAVVVMEWAGLFKEHLPPDTHFLSIAIDGENRIFSSDLLG